MRGSARLPTAWFRAAGWWRSSSLTRAVRGRFRGPPGRRRRHCSASCPRQSDGSTRWWSASTSRSIAGIARELTERGVPCPSEVDPQRNRHRDGAAWTLRTVAVILSNLRYTGRLVWGRQQQAARRSGSRRHQSMSAGEWAVSVRPAHPALVSEPEFIAASTSVPHVRPGTAEPQLPALRARPVRCLRAAHGLALGARPRRLSVPSRCADHHAVETAHTLGKRAPVG